MMEPEEDAGGYRRVRRPKDKEDVIARLRAEPGAAFAEIRDVLVFAAALGFEEGRSVPFSESSESIRWETFQNRYFSEDLVRLIAVAHTDDKTIASAARQQEQLDVFEAYANGGLEILEQRLAASAAEEPLDLVLQMIQARLGDARGIDALIDLAGG